MWPQPDSFGPFDFRQVCCRHDIGRFHCSGDHVNCWLVTRSTWGCSLKTVENVDDLAADALSQASDKPDLARGLAERALRTALSIGALEAASVASRALGIARLHLRDLKGSSSALRAAISLAERAGSPRLAAEARMPLAVTLGVRGLSSRAISEIEAALADLDGPAAARGLVQRAAVLQDLGRIDESLADVRRALPLLRQSGDAAWEIRALSNRSLIFITRRAFTAAEEDLQAARRLCAENGMELFAAYLEHNLGWLNSSRGEVVVALEHFREAEQAFERLGMEVGSLFADQGELLLSVRLLDEARTAAESAVRVHRAQRRHLQVPEALLLLSTVALMQGDIEVSSVSAQQAERGYRRLGRTDGLALARYAKLQASIVVDPTSVAPSRARRSAEELAAEGWIVPALEARVMAGRLALDRGHRTEARRDLRAAGRARFNGPADARVRAWFAEALLRGADGNRRAAKSAVSAGLRVVENYQATLGATELRAHVSTQRGSLAALGLRMALKDGDPRGVLSFVERGRASALRWRAVRPPDDPLLARDLADLRATMSEIDEQRSAGGRSVTELAQRQVRLEHAVAEHWRRLPADSVRLMKPHSIAELAGSLGDVALVEYVELDDVLHAVTLVAGRARLHDLGPLGPIRQNLPHLLFALRRLANPRSSEMARTAALAAVDRLRDPIDRQLMGPLMARIGERPLLVVPVGRLQSLPWSILPSCTGRPVTISPSASLWFGATTRPTPEPDAAITVVAGPDLVGAHQEAVAVAAVHTDALALTGGDATVAAVSAAMDGAALVHVAAHGRLRSDNPLFSSLLMVDGPLTVYDLERLGRAPHHVVLAACEAALPHVVSIDEVLGLAAALLAQGTTSLIAPVISVVDQETVPLMLSYHAELRAGRSAAEALAMVQKEAVAHGDAYWASAAAFVCMGAGHRSDLLQRGVRAGTRTTHLNDHVSVVPQRGL